MRIFVVFKLFMNNCRSWRNRDGLISINVINFECATFHHQGVDAKFLKWTEGHRILRKIKCKIFFQRTPAFVTWFLCYLLEMTLMTILIFSGNRLMMEISRCCEIVGIKLTAAILRRNSLVFLEYVFIWT